MPHLYLQALVSRQGVGYGTADIHGCRPIAQGTSASTSAPQGPPRDCRRKGSACQSKAWDWLQQSTGKAQGSRAVALQWRATWFASADRKTCEPPSHPSKRGGWQRRVVHCTTPALPATWAGRGREMGILWGVDRIGCALISWVDEDTMYQSDLLRFVPSPMARPPGTWMRATGQESGPPVSQRCLGQRRTSRSSWSVPLPRGR